MIVPYFQLALAGLASFALGRVMAPYYIAWLRHRKLGDRPRDELELHRTKAGTPTMGGWLIVAPAALIGLVNTRSAPEALPALAGLLLFALFGAADDYAKLTGGRGLGFQVRWKFLLHGALALALGLWLQRGLGVDSVYVPGVGEVALGAAFAPFAALVVFCAAAGANETDGLDGLATGVTLVILLALLAIALWQGNAVVAVLCLAAMGALLAFLWDNAHPAAVFMGDTGSLAIGAFVGVIALQLGAALVLPAIAVIYVIETASVIIQVAYFKRTGGRRVFKRAPIHHHFELVGWKETQIVQRFWIVGALGALAGLGLYFWSR